MSFGSLNLNLIVWTITPNLWKCWIEKKSVLLLNWYYFYFHLLFYEIICHLLLKTLLFVSPCVSIIEIVFFCFSCIHCYEIYDWKHILQFSTEHTFPPSFLCFLPYESWTLFSRNFYYVCYHFFEINFTLPK